MEIRGASALLDDLNRRKTMKFLTSKFGISNVECVFSGGGAGHYIISAKKNEIEETFYGLAGLFHNDSGGGLKLLYGQAEYTGHYAKDLGTAMFDSEKRISGSLLSGFPPDHNGFFQECASCSGMAEHVISFGNDEDRALCGICYKKTLYARNIEAGLWADFSQFLLEKNIKCNRPETFEDIGDRCFSKKGFTALVYADGNSMGNLISQIDNKEEFDFFSRTVDQSIRDACHEALYELLILKQNYDEILPVDILLLGGDDLIVYLTAETAFPFAISVAKKFNELTKQKFSEKKEYSFFSEKLKERGLTISLGVVYGKSHTPISMMLEQSDELLKSAKKAGSEDRRADSFYSPSYIDYHISTSYNQVNVSACRTNYQEINNLKPVKLYQKPYSLEDAETLYKHANSLKSIGIPNTRLNRLGKAPFMGKMNATLECLNVYTRAGTRNKRLAIWKALEPFGCINNMPWNETSETEDTTMLVDLIEITGFCGNGKTYYEEEENYET